MLEKYFIDTLESLKAENTDLKMRVDVLEHQKMIFIDKNPVKFELLPIKTIVEKLNKKGITVDEVINEYGTDDLVKLIDMCDLVKEVKFNVDKGVVLYEGKYYELETYYSGYKFDDRVFMDKYEYTYNVSSDELYDSLRQYKRNLESEKKEN